MKDEYNKMTIREVIEKLPLEEMVQVLKLKGLNNQEIIELLEYEKDRIIRENNKKNWVSILEEIFNEQKIK